MNSHVMPILVVFSLLNATTASAQTVEPETLPGLSPMGPAASPPGSIRETEDIRKKYTTVGFRGIHLGMTRDDLLFLLNYDDAFPWRISQKSDISDDVLFMVCGSDDRCVIGCEGTGEDESCYEIRQVYVEFYKEKIFGIGIESPRYSAKEIDPYLKDWADFAVAGLSLKYGKPTTVIRPVGAVNVLSFKENYYSAFCLWDKGSALISVNGTRSDRYFQAEVLYEDRAALKSKAVEQEQSRHIEF